MDHSALKDCYRFLGFEAIPFSITPDTSLFFPSSQYVTVFNQISHACMNGVLAVLTGEIGLGKTMVIRCVLRKMPPQVKVAYLLNPLLDHHELLRQIYTEFTGITAPADKPYSALHGELIEHVLQGSANGQRYAVIVDEAHRLSPDSLEMLRLLSNLETEHFKLIGLTLVGQPELNRTLMLGSMRPLRERIGLWLKLRPMNHAECSAYIQHRIKLTHRDGQFAFTPLAQWWIHRLSKGVPRRINLAAERAILLAFAGSTQRVNWSMARQACSEFKKVWK